MRVEGAGTHGKIGTYTWGKCRCDDCRLVARDRRRFYRAQARKADPSCTVPCALCDDWFAAEWLRDRHEVLIHSSGVDDHAARILRATNQEVA